jgi:hypothetical protein
MNNLIIKKSQIVEAQFTTGIVLNNKYNFTEIPNLSANNLIIYGIECYTAAQLAKTPSGNTTIANADAINVIVTFRNTKKEEFVYQMPVYSLIRANNGGFVTMFKPQLVNLTDCYVQVVAAGTLATNQSVAFNLYYDVI